jgi:aryl-alcohol dehydrogenase-like predicted oxidoreductase
MKASSIKNNIIIGTAQLGTNYGIANTEKNININKKIEFLNFAYKNGLISFDTAYAYKNSHKIIGKWIREYKLNPELSSKIPNLKLYKYKDIDIIFNEILKELNVKKLKNLLLHNPEDWNNKKIKIYIENKIKDNIISKFGISIYDIQSIPQDDLIKVIQLPGNIFNQKILISDKLNKFIETGGLVQVRSIFIQGLLLMEPSKIPNKFDQIKKGLIHFANISKELKIDKKYLAIKCVKYLLPQAQVILGFDTINQIQSLLNVGNEDIKESDVKEILKVGRSYDNKLWDPRTW